MQSLGMFCINLNQMTSLSPPGEEETSPQNLSLSYCHSGMPVFFFKRNQKTLSRTGFDQLNWRFSVTSLDERF